MKLLGRLEQQTGILVDRRPLQQLGRYSEVRKNPPVLRMDQHTVRGHVARNEPSPGEGDRARGRSAQNAGACLRIERPRPEQVAQPGMLGPLDGYEEASVLFAERPRPEQVGMVHRATRVDRVAQAHGCASSRRAWLERDQKSSVASVMRRSIVLTRGRARTGRRDSQFHVTRNRRRSPRSPAPGRVKEQAAEATARAGLRGPEQEGPRRPEQAEAQAGWRVRQERHRAREAPLRAVAGWPARSVAAPRPLGASGTAWAEPGAARVPGASPRAPAAGPRAAAPSERGSASRTLGRPRRLDERWRTRSRA